MPPPTIVYLNGVSSSGKTSISRTLQDALDEPYFYVPFDAFGAMKPRRPRPTDTGLLWQNLTERLFPGYVMPAFHDCIVGYAERGMNVIADAATTRDGLHEIARRCAAYRMYVVGIQCSITELERRERARHDRIIGQARRQLESLHQDVVYDLEVDTSNASPEACAAHILRFLASGLPPRARHTLALSPSGPNSTDEPLIPGSR